MRGGSSRPGVSSPITRRTSAERVRIMLENMKQSIEDATAGLNVSQAAANHPLSPGATSAAAALSSSSAAAPSVAQPTTV